MNDKTNKRSWLSSGLYCAAGLGLGYFVIPGYAGMLAAAAVPQVSVPVIGTALTQAVKVQTMTKAYNAAMSVAPLVSVASAEVMKAVADRVYLQAQTQVNDATELLDEGIDMGITPPTV